MPSSFATTTFFFVVVVLAAAVTHARCPFADLASTDPADREHLEALFADLAGTDPADREHLEALCPHEHATESVDPGTTTVQGCTCESTCGASVDFGAAKCDWCYTADDCGHYSFSRFKYYDYCVYPTNTTYESAHSWQEKQAALWSDVTADTTHGEYPNVLNIIAESIQTTFDDGWDVMPAGRVKYIHSVGAVCQFDLAVDSSSPYTGLLAGGQTAHGIIRMGPAKPPTDDNLTPGVGIKFLRTGVRSGNFVGLWTLDGGESWDFFAQNQTNHIPAPSGTVAVLAKKFNQGSNCATQVGLSDLCQHGQDGTAADEPVFPFRVDMVPADVHTPSAASTLDTLMGYLADIEPGTALYTMVAYDSPEDYAAGRGRRLGDMVTTTECTTSAFGDAKLFFRHQRIEEDWQLRPEWMDQLDGERDCGFSSIDPDPPSKCSEEKVAVDGGL